MATRLMALDNKPGSPDLPTSSIKNESNSEVRFQHVLAREGRQHKDSDTLNHSKEEKRQSVKDDRSDSKPQANTLKSTSRSVASFSLKNKLNNEAAGSEFDNKNKEVDRQEDTQSLNTTDDNIQVNLENIQTANINLSANDVKLVNVVQDENMELGYLDNNQVKEISDSIIIDSAAINGSTSKLLNSSKTDEKLDEILTSVDESLVESAATTSQIHSSLPINLKDQNLLISEVSLNEEAEVNILESGENNVEKEPLINEENIINPVAVAIPINSKDAEFSQAQGISISPSIITNENKLLKVQEAIVNIPLTSNNAENEIAHEEDLSTPILLASNRELEKINKGKAVLPEVQSSSNQNNLEELTVTDQETLDFGQSDNFNNNLLLKVDSFVTINEGKLSVFFKEIANLPEENIPHRADQVTMAVKSALNRGHSEISLHMYPEDLGAVDIKIEFSEIGKVQSIKFFAAEKSTLEILQKDYSILERSLKEVINADDASLSFNLKDGKGESSDYQPQENFNLNSFGENRERAITSNYVITTHIQEDDQVNITV